MMRLKNFHIALQLLLIFSFCLSLTAQVTVDTSTKTPEEKAEAAALVALYKYNKLKTVSDAAAITYLLANDALGILNTALKIAKSEESSTTNTLVTDAFYGSLDLAGLDPADVATTAAATILTSIKTGWELAKIKAKKSDIEAAYNEQMSFVQTKHSEWATAAAKTITAEAKMDAAFAAWDALKPLTYEFGPEDGNTTIQAGDSHVSFLELSKSWSSVNWYVKSPSSQDVIIEDDNETEKGRLVYGIYANPDGRKRSALNHSYDELGEYVITVSAVVASTGEVVEESYTLKVLPKKLQEGVFVNQTGFKVYETLTVKVVKDKLSTVNMYRDSINVWTTTGQIFMAGGSSTDGETATMEYTFDTGDIGSHKVTVWISYKSGTKTEFTSHTFYIDVSN